MSTVVDLKTKEEKDAALDRRIEALRKKNEALVRRYQEIEEDKKKAEQEGIAVKTHPPRKGRPHDGPPEGDRWRTEKENFTVTVDLSKPAGEKRVINDWKQGPPRDRRDSEEGYDPRPQGESPPRRASSGRLSRGGQRGGGSRQERREQRTDRPLADSRQSHDRPPREGRPPREERPPREDRGPSMEGPGEGPGRSERAPRRGRGGREREGGPPPQGGDRKSKEWEEKRRQNIEKMNEEMEKIAEYERGQRPAEGDKPIRNFLDDPRRSGPVPDMDRKEGSRRHVRNWGGVDFDNVKTGSELEKEWTSRRPGGPKGSMDMTMSMTGRERAEYLRWKKEREEIDEERLARHRNATGQWRREWDAQKIDGLFKEDPAVAVEGMLPDQGGRDDMKGPPKVPTFGDFLGQGRGPREGGRGRGQSYSMHDNRWEAEEEKEKEDKPKKEEKTWKEERKPKSPSSQNMEKSGDADEDEWEDASDEEDYDTDGDDDDEGEEEGRDGQSTKKAPRPETTALKPVATSPLPSTPPSATSPKEKRTPRPKVYIPSPQEAQNSPDGLKPLSPFSLLDGHQPVRDWGEEMEMQSPRSSMGESPPKPPSTDEGPAQVKVQEDSRNSSPSPNEKERDKRTVVVTAAPPEETLIQEKNPASSSLDPVSTPNDPPEKEKTTAIPPAQETPATPTEDEAPAAAPVLEADQSLSGLATAPETAPDTSEQSSSG
ncbi:coiled-coil domain-containing protein 9-like [Salvelinus namaycush]|uniref:Coiled-coil domain-containing protein 9-like n=1 Tax=Salvelinus namaycush TaxID=8040 RepID=A0A8U0P2C5_SALNM|nr:coiled-coil domain-containing protein 9-like [Salvelinus namaycush]